MVSCYPNEERQQTHEGLTESTGTDVHAQGIRAVQDVEGSFGGGDGVWASQEDAVL